MERVERDTIVPATCAGMRFDQAAARLFPEYSRSRIKGWILNGTATLDGAPRKPRDRVLGGERLVVNAQIAAEEVVAAEPMPLDIAYADDDLLIIDKPAGLVVHPGAGHRDATLQNGLLHAYPELAHVPRAGIVHRLDKDTSGLMLIARRVPTHTALVRALAQRTIKREYRAVCYGVLTGGGTVDAPIRRHATQRTRMAVHPDGREARTHYRVARRFAAHTEINVRLETGRTHQIRVHMAHVRHPLLGDPVYGGRLRLPKAADESLTLLLRRFNRQALHAERLTLEHPISGDELLVERPPPADFLTLTDALDTHGKAHD
ncbi:MAG: 23S rRNA pseudouridine(1911/1915/1917) synthase RluD [Pseudomonadota bacterium]